MQNQDIFVPIKLKGFIFLAFWVTVGFLTFLKSVVIARWLGGPVKGLFYRLCLIIDLFSRKVVGWEVWETEEAKYAESLVKKAVINEKIQGVPLVLHSNMGAQ
ncbi:hypothetical protein [Ornithinibacillus salinisoli]